MVMPVVRIERVNYVPEGLMDMDRQNQFTFIDSTELEPLHCFNSFSVYYLMIGGHAE